MTAPVYGLDYSQSHPGVAAIRAAGYTFVCRYLSNTTLPGKNLTLAEADALRAAGIAIVSNWEWSAGAALKGRAQGVQDARDAAAQAKACGMPDDRPIYFSVDIDTTPGNYAAIDAYFAGIISALGLARTGVYGEYDLVAHAAAVHEVRWVWQTYAWSGKPARWFAGAHIRQVQNGIKVGGADCDRDQAMVADYGQWGHIEEDDMAQIDQADWDAAKWRLEGLVNGRDAVANGPTKGERIQLVADLKALAQTQVSATGGMTDDDRALIKGLTDAVTALNNRLSTP